MATRQTQDYYILQVQTLLKNILYLVLFLFVFLLFCLFCGEYDIGGSWVLGVQRTKCLVGSELDMAKKIVREKDARCYKLK